MNDRALIYFPFNSTSQIENDEILTYVRELLDYLNRNDDRIVLIGFPIVIIENVTVNDNVTLIIPAGVVVKFSSSRQLTVNGTLEAIGSSDDWIVFTSVKDDSYGGDTNADDNSTRPSPGDWRGRDEDRDEDHDND